MPRERPNLVVKHVAMAEGDKPKQPNIDKGGNEEAFTLGFGNCSGSGFPLLQPWKPSVTMAPGLLLAGLLALTQAWCVNTIHENLLWFSQLTVGVTQTGILDTVLIQNFN